MPELPEVETVRRTLLKYVLNKKIIDVSIYWDNIIAFPSIDVFKEEIKYEKIGNILRRGKFLMFELDNYFLLSHLRMEGKYFIRKKGDIRNKHEHVIFLFDDDTELRYHDTRKFGKMYLIKKEDVYKEGPLVKLGLEPFDSNLDIQYLKNKFKSKPIKSELLDQSIIAGIGNIYADEILFLSNINPYVLATDLSLKNYDDIIKNTKDIFNKAILKGGTTVRSYSSLNGIHGLFQNELLVHTKKVCKVCGSNIIKGVISGRSSYYCPKCQKK